MCSIVHELHQVQERQEAHDLGGKRIFSAGEIGALHVLAHKYHDEDRIELGYEILQQRLNGRSGSGSQWCHIQFHMALFELNLGMWDRAYRRFRSHILGPASRHPIALTDAPALLWWLLLDAPGPVELPWEPVRHMAISQLHQSGDPFVEVHNMLALAGARDAAGLDAWIERSGQDVAFPLLHRTALALRALAAGKGRDAADMLAPLLPDLNRLGGSGVQNRLFERIVEYCVAQSQSDMAVRFRVAA